MLLSSYFLPGLDEVVRRVSKGLRRGEEEFGVKTKSILCARYSKELNDLEETLRLCSSHYQDGVVGLDLLTLQPQVGYVGKSISIGIIIQVMTF